MKLLIVLAVLVGGVWWYVASEKAAASKPMAANHIQTITLKGKVLTCGTDWGSGFHNPMVSVQSESALVTLSLDDGADCEAVQEGGMYEIKLKTTTFQKYSITSIEMLR